MKKRGSESLRQTEKLTNLTPPIRENLLIKNMDASYYSYGLEERSLKDEGEEIGLELDDPDEESENELPKNSD